MVQIQIDNQKIDTQIVQIEILIMLEIHKVLEVNKQSGVQIENLPMQDQCKYWVQIKLKNLKLFKVDHFLKLLIEILFKLVTENMEILKKESNFKEF